MKKNIFKAIAIISFSGLQVFADESSDWQKKTQQAWENVSNKFDNINKSEYIQNTKDLARDGFNKFTKKEETFLEKVVRLIDQKKADCLKSYNQLKIEAAQKKNDNAKQHWTNIMRKWDSVGLTAASWEGLVAISALIKSCCD